MRPLLAGLPFAAVLGLSSTALADSGSMSQSCSAQIRVCQGTSCSNESVTLYAHQFASVFQGEILSESHTFTMTGPIGSSSDYPAPTRLESPFLIYEGDDFALAIPYKSGHGMFVRQLNEPHALDWQPLCGAGSPIPGQAGGEGPSGPVVNGSHSHSKSCSGQMRTCDGTVCTDRYFYAFTYQFAYVMNGSLMSESHSLSFSGELGSQDDYELSRAAGAHVIYSGPKYEVAAPFKSGLPSYYRQKGAIDSDWRKLCN